MINSKEILADFQFAANRISKFSLETYDTVNKGVKAQVSIEFDYNILNLEEQEDKYLCVIEVTVLIKARVKNFTLYRINLKMEGIFIGNPNKLSIENFREMSELNGVATLFQLCRAYIVSVSALSGINPPIRFPMINIYSLKEKKEKKSQK